MVNELEQRLAQAIERGHLSAEEENDPEMVRLWRAHQKLEAALPTLDSDPPVIAVNREVPSEIGKYRIERKLGDGAFGEVYKGYDVELERSVALKRPLVPPSQGDSSFVREARSASNITSQYVVTIHDVLTEAPSGPWIVSEFVDGDSMRAWIEKKRSLKKRILLFYYVVKGVGAAHAQNVIHRDLKPENVLVGKDGLPRVADFGMAKQLRSETLQTQTQQGNIKGTPPYMAPEQLRGYTDKIDERSDIFALGVMLYELLTGSRPFQGEGWYELLKQIDETIPVHPFQTAVGQSLKEGENGEYISKICLRCIKKDHRQRYQSTHDLLNDLKRCIENKPPNPFPPDPRKKSSPAATEENTSEPKQPVVAISVPNKKARTVPRWYQRGPFKLFYFYFYGISKAVICKGRAGREEFNGFLTGAAIVWFLIILLRFFIAEERGVDISEVLLQDRFENVFFCIPIWLSIIATPALTIRRLHDTGRSGWWNVLGLNPVLGWVKLYGFWTQKGDSCENMYGPENTAVPNE